MARVTAAEVKEILDTTLTDARVDAFIIAASAAVDEMLGNSNLGATLLKEIERWLAAHYIVATIERQATHEKAGPVEQRFADVFGQYLLSTTYGQTAAQLDTTGTLSNAGKKVPNLKAINEDYS